MRNISPNDGLLNNTSVKVLQVTRALVKVMVLENAQVHYIPRINFSIPIGHKSLSILRKQFPLRPAYAKTINRSQGATLDRCGVDLREDPFCHGQLLVAMSRVRDQDSILVLTAPDKQLSENTVSTRNVVYKNLLS